MVLLWRRAFRAHCLYLRWHLRDLKPQEARSSCLALPYLLRSSLQPGTHPVWEESGRWNPTEVDKLNVPSLQPYSIATKRLLFDCLCIYL